MYQSIPSGITMELPMTDQMRKDLEELRMFFEELSRRSGAVPIIGSLDCPVAAEQYGDRGRPCYVVFVYKKADKTYGCRHTRCYRDGDGGGPSFKSLEGAIRHQERHHFC